MRTYEGMAVMRSVLIHCAAALLGCGGLARAAEPFVWLEANRRDPFTYRAPIAVVPPSGNNGRTNQGGEGVPPPPPPVDTSALRAGARECISASLVSLGRGEYETVAAWAGPLTARMDEAGLGDDDLYHRLRQVNETAHRLRERAEVERLIREAKIRPEGVVWGETDAVVLIGGAVLREGDVVSGMTIESIERSGAVILMLRGVRVRVAP
jgi:hypothetical protein